MIQAQNIELAFGNRSLFDRLSFIINEDDRVGLVGRNGSGKTTLLKALGDPSILDSGKISFSGGCKIAYMPQEVVLASERSVLDETLTSYTEMSDLQREACRLERCMQDASDNSLVEQYGVVQEKLSFLNPEKLIAQAKKVLMGLGFSIAQLSEPVSILSVGWKMRIVLAKLLLQEADFYLFDEPTNHLDLSAKEWFLDYLRHASFGFVIICHERYFLDELCTKIFELQHGKGIWYSGNYTNYVIKKEHAIALHEAQYERQQKELQRKQATIERFRSGTKAKMAASMEKSLAKIERIEAISHERTVQFRFPPLQPSGKLVAEVSNVSYAFGDRKLFERISFDIEAGQKIALIASNGKGKTTLLHLIAGALPLQSGTIHLGHNVRHALFAQDQNKVLNPQLSIMENIQRVCPASITDQNIRTFLGGFLLTGDDAYKKVGVLSGGEKNKVGMVIVLLQQANFLLLDEPTNHLDIPSKEALLKALQQFSGTVIFVSHDRDFINALATDIIELTAEKAVHYRGNYDDYLYYKKMQEGGGQQAKLSSNKHVARSASKEVAPDKEKKKSHRLLEEAILKLEQRIEKVQVSFAELEYGTSAFQAACTELKALEKQLKEAEKNWEEAQLLDE